MISCQYDLYVQGFFFFNGEQTIHFVATLLVFSRMAFHIGVTENEQFSVLACFLPSE